MELKLLNRSHWMKIIEYILRNWHDLHKQYRMWTKFSMVRRRKPPMWPSVENGEKRDGAVISDVSREFYNEEYVSRGRLLITPKASPNQSYVRQRFDDARSTPIGHHSLAVCTVNSIPPMYRVRANEPKPMVIGSSRTRIIENRYHTAHDRWWEV